MIVGVTGRTETYCPCREKGSDVVSICECWCRLYERVGSRDCRAPGTGLVVFGALFLEVFVVTKLFVGNLPFSATESALVDCSLSLDMN